MRRPSLISNWKRVSTKAYSVRLILLAMFFSGLEVALPFIPLDVSAGTFAAASGVISAVAFASRLIAQKELKE